MASIKEATRTAIDFARDTLGEERTRSLQLEEIESGSDDGSEVWRITLSTVSTDAAKGFAALQSTHPKREYKTFVVRKDTGEVVAMKIRSLADA